MGAATKHARRHTATLVGTVSISRLCGCVEKVAADLRLATSDVSVMNVMSPAVSVPCYGRVVLHNRHQTGGRKNMGIEKKGRVQKN